MDKVYASFFAEKMNTILMILKGYSPVCIEMLQYLSDLRCFPFTSLMYPRQFPMGIPPIPALRSACACIR